MANPRLYNFVRRYTTLSSALQMLQQRKITLLSPSKWDDTNDAYFMDMYRANLRADGDPKAVLAVCCTMAKETYHHWRIFTQGIEGVCIEFQRVPLEACIAALPGFRCGAVDYLQVGELEQMGPDDFHRLPFIKREGYRDEREWRVIAESDGGQEFAELPIEIAWINSIAFSPWMPPPLVDNLRSIIRPMLAGHKIPLRASSLTHSEKWKDAGRRLAGLNPPSSPQ
jgi:hypothetical protein